MLPLSGSDGSAISEGDARFLDASVAALHAYQADLEAAVNALASQGSEQSQSLMSDCLKAVDALHTTMALHKEVLPPSFFKLCLHITRGVQLGFFMKQFTWLKCAAHAGDGSQESSAESCLWPGNDLSGSAWTRTSRLVAWL